MMFTLRMMTAGCLLALSAAAVMETQSSNKLKYPHLLTPQASHPPLHPSASSSVSSSASPLPDSCYTTITDLRHLRTTVVTHRCYTRTSKFPAEPCPTLSCPPPSSDLVCLEYIKVSSLTVPCATDCCPTTSTTYKPYESVPCPTCDPCRIPTEWITYTTGCPGTPTITETNIITPPPYHN